MLKIDFVGSRDHSQPCLFFSEYWRRSLAFSSGEGAREIMGEDVLGVVESICLRNGFVIPCSR